MFGLPHVHLQTVMLLALLALAWNYRAELAAFLQRFVPAGRQAAERIGDAVEQLTTGESREAFVAELKQFTSRFGQELGLSWFLEGKSYNEALEAYVVVLQKPTGPPPPAPTSAEAKA